MDNKSLIPKSSNISFAKYNDLEYSKIEKYKITYDYLTICRVNIKNSNFKNCDIIASRINEIKLFNIDLNNSDIISNEIIDAVFSNVDFEGTCIDDTNFTRCLFINCKFNNQSTKNCTFKDCSFENIKPISSLMELNTYTNCTFQSCEFTSSFHYQIFDNCKYINMLIKPELLGYNFGLFFNSQQNSGIILLGYDETDTTNDVIISNLTDYFVNKFLFINAMILSLNTDFNTNQMLFMNWANTLKKTINHNGMIKSNEIIFIKNIIINMFCNQLIAPIIVINLYNQLLDIYKNCECSNKIQESLLVLLNSIQKEIHNYLNNLQVELKELPTFNSDIEISIKYETKPTVSLCNILNEFYVGKCIQTKTMYGSFIEWISSPENILECLKIFISLLGITVPIVYSSIKDKKEKKNNKSNNNPVMPQVLFINSDNISLNINVQNGCQIINNNNIIEKDFCGYTNENIKYININSGK